MRAARPIGEAMRDVVWRSLIVMTAAALLVVAAFTSGLAERAAESAGHATGDHAPGVSSEGDFVAHLMAQRSEARERALEILELTEREEVRDLAETVVREQDSAIASLRSGLHDAHGEQAIAVAHEPTMRPFVGLHAHEADQVFVADMIIHHESVAALAESYLALREPLRPELVAHAEESLRSARAEIGVLRLMLQMWGVAPADHDSH